MFIMKYRNLIIFVTCLTLLVLIHIALIITPHQFFNNVGSQDLVGTFNRLNAGLIYYPLLIGLIVSFYLEFIKKK